MITQCLRQTSLPLAIPRLKVRAMDGRNAMVPDMLHVRSTMLIRTGAHRALALLVFFLAGLLSMPGCQVESVTTGTSGTPMPPKPRAAPDVPESAPATRMVFTPASKPQDTNGNGYPDQLTCTVILMPQNYYVGVHRPGRMVLTLVPMGTAGRADIEPIAEWIFNEDDLRAGQMRSGYGEGYVFRFSLLEFGSDEYPLSRADLMCRFEPTGEGPIVYSNGVRSILIGRR